MGLIRILADGCFDCLHIGHVVHLQEARALGDMLMVALTADSWVGKGPGRPVFNWRERCDMLSALRCVDQVHLVYSGIDAIELLKPDIYVKGIEYKDKLEERELCDRLGIRVVFLDTKPVYSSTKIVNGELYGHRKGDR